MKFSNSIISKIKIMGEVFYHTFLTKNKVLAYIVPEEVTKTDALEIGKKVQEVISMRGWMLIQEIMNKEIRLINMIPMVENLGLYGYSKKRKAKKKNPKTNLTKKRKSKDNRKNK